jgi:hypothetical protein
MLIYRFRITSDDHEDFLREIEIQPGQTFLDFHEAIVSYSDLEKCEKAYFYTADKKHQEISLKPVKKQVKKYDGDLDEIVTETRPVHLMKNSPLKKFIEDPHQRMIYEFHGKEPLVFNLELFKILKTEELVSLPRCVKSVGELPKRVEIPMAPVLAPPEEEAPIHPPLFARGKESLFEGIQENEKELAEIEDHLDEILMEETREEPEMEKSSGDTDVEEPEEEGETQMQSIDEFEDIESLEIKSRDFSGESDEY